MITDNSELSKIGNNPTANYREQVDVRLVDSLADELCHEYSNTDFRKWYCNIIYELGLPRVNEIRGRCRDAKQPGRLFSKLAKAEIQHMKVQRLRNG